MKLHKNVALTPKQRQEIQRLYAAGQVSYAQLARQFTVSRKTVIKWAKRTHNQDQSSAPKKHHQRVTDAYRLAVVTYRQANPTHGPVRIERQLRDEHGPFAPVRFGLSSKQTKPKSLAARKCRSYPRADIERRWTYSNCPHSKATAGLTGPPARYKISIIHLATRIKYSEIHDNYQSETIAQVFKRSLDILPPFLSPPGGPASPTTP